MKGTGYDRGHHVGGNDLTRVVNPLYDPAYPPALRKLLATYHEHQSMFSDVQVSRQQIRDQEDMARITSRLESTLRTKVDAAVEAIHWTILAMVMPLGMLAKVHRSKLVVAAATMVVGTTIAQRFVKSLFPAVAVSKKDRIPERLLAHQKAVRDAYEVSNCSPQYGEHCNNTFVTHIENIIRGMVDKRGGGGHAHVYTIPVYKPTPCPETSSGRNFRETRHEVRVTALECSDGGFVWVPTHWFKVILSYDQRWSARRTPQELIAFGSEQPIDSASTFDPTVEERDIPVRPKLTGWEVISYPNGPVDDRTIQYEDLTHYILNDVTRFSGIFFPETCAKVPRLSPFIINGVITPNVPQSAIDKRQGRPRPGFDAKDFKRTSSNSPF